MTAAEVVLAHATALFWRNRAKALAAQLEAAEARNEMFVALLERKGQR